MLPLFKYIIPQSTQAEPVALNPSFHYLRVTVDERVIYLASGTPNLDIPNTVNVWYSAEREVLRIQNGRLVAAVGPTTEWRAANLPSLPTWRELAQKTSPLKWTRIRDVMPGYRYELRDELVLQRIPAPSDSQLKNVDPRALIWFEERFEHADTESAALPSARYAVEIFDGKERVLYGEQCISATLCFSWQRWPARVKDNL